MNADVVAVDVIGRLLLDGRIELKSDALLQFSEKALGSPPMPQEKKFQPGAFAMFAQIDARASSTKTRQSLAWHPTGPALLEDLDSAAYFPS